MNTSPLLLPSRRVSVFAAVLRALGALGGAALLVLLHGCASKPELVRPVRPNCGQFTLTAHSEPAPEGPHMVTEVSFQFDPAACGISCDCGSVVFVQMIRFVDRRAGLAAYFQPDEEQFNRMVTGFTSNRFEFNGWAIDRVVGKTSAYCGQNNDGSWDLLKVDPLTGAHGPGEIQPGSNQRAAVLRGGIHVVGDDYLCQVVVVAVCMDPNTECNHKIVGHMGYSFIRLPGAAALSSVTDYREPWLLEVFDEALQRWNRQSGKQLFSVEPLP